MASSSLVLHAGGKLVTFEELREYRAPPPEGRGIRFPMTPYSARSRKRLARPATK